MLSVSSHKLIDYRLLRFLIQCLRGASVYVQSVRRWWLNVTVCKGHLALWHRALKEIGGRYGSAVFTYFRFLKWLFQFNVFLLIFNLSFIAVPEIVHMPNSTINSTFKGLELLTGAVRTTMHFLNTCDYLCDCRFLADPSSIQSDTQYEKTILETKSTWL